MKHEDKLPVLAFPDRQQARPDRKSAHPDDLARAIAALRQALAAETGRGTGHAAGADHAVAPLSGDARYDAQAGSQDAFCWVGVPRPRWRAGSDLPDRSGPSGQGSAAPAKTDIDGQDHTDSRDPLARRITVLHFPQFSMERWLRDADRRGAHYPDDLPIALAIEGAHGPVVHAVNRAATLEGVQVGARVVDMRALCPTLHLDFADPPGDRVALGRLVLWARRWCPWTAIDGDRGIVMDTTGSDHLWGGEAALLREIEEKLSGLGLTTQLATAPTHGAAWGFARFGGVRVLCSPEDLPLQIGRLPVRSLRLTGDTVLLLHRLGLKTVADVMAVPRLSLARRFSRAPLIENPLLRLDQMMGRLAEPVSAADDPPRFAVESRLAEPVQDPTAWLPELCLELCGGMSAAGYGARRVRITVYRTDGEVSSVDVATARASRDADHLQRLFDGKLDRIDPGFGFDLITLSAVVAEKLSTVQRRLDGRSDDGADLGRLVDRVTARLGSSALRLPAPGQSHIPERAEGWMPAMAVSSLSHRPDGDTAYRPDRPLRLFDHPQEVRVLYAVPEGPPAQFIWRRIHHKVTRFSGPERVAPEWWADLPGTRLRDYYRVEDHLGARFWIYREGVLGDRRGDTPRWFVHGVFA